MGDNMKKFISIFLSAVLLVTAFAGCSTGETESETEEDSITYVVDTNYEENMTASSIRAYETLCEAVVNGEDTASYNINLSDDVNRLFYSSFPLSYLVESITETDDSSGVVITYTNDTETHLQLVSEFYEKVESIIAECEEGTTTDDEFILNLYTYISSNTTADTSSNSAYNVIIEGTGYRSSMVYAFAYILLYNGIEASIASSVDDGVITYMAEVPFSDGYFMFCPYNETAKTGGYGLSYFALDYTDLYNLGIEAITYLNNVSVIFDDYDVSFSDLRDTYSYTYADGVITAIDIDGNTVEVEI